MKVSASGNVNFRAASGMGIKTLDAGEYTVVVLTAADATASACRTPASDQANGSRPQDLARRNPTA